ncbi:MAG: lipoprotein signal peptidase [Tepidiforma sp.]|nr:MAG: lipoprotein signal peptidase [Tepidiforma sp.]
MEEVHARSGTGPRLAAARRDGWFLIVAAAVLVLDQLTKWFVRVNLDRGEVVEVLPFFRLVHVTNTGAAFGMLQGAGPLLVVASVAGLAAIVVYLFNPGFAHPVVRLGLALMLGGAVGNLIDRVTEGRVVDFLKVPNWPAFNVADSAISIGVVILLWSMLFQAPDEDEPSSSSQEQADGSTR